jgi:hypothetical protein
MTNVSAYMEQVARHYFGEPTSKKGHELRWGTHGSMAVDLRKGTWYSHEDNTGGGVIDLVRLHEPASMNGSIADVMESKFGIPKRTQQTLKPAKYLAHQYDYYDEDGVLRYQVQRFEPKTFRQRRPDDKGGWIYNMNEVEALPYNLVGMLEQPGAPVFVVEGEKCADRLIKLGLVATTNHGGSKNWRPELNRYFQGRNVVVIPDNDQAGQAHADVVVGQLYGVTGALKRLELPGVPEKGDVIDWLFKGGTRRELVQLAKDAPIYEDDPGVVEPDLRPDIFETYDIDYLMNMPPIEWLMEGLLTKHGFGVIYGAPGIGKSFMSIDWALTIACGLEWHGRPTKRGAVLYIAAEGVAGLGKRIKAWKAHNDVESITDFHVLPQAVKLLEPLDLDKLTRTIDHFGVEFSLIVIDTVARTLAATGSDENDATQAGLFVEACGAIQRHAGCAVLAVHHSGKDASRGQRGSSAIQGGCDTVLALSGADGLVTLKVEKQKDAEGVPPTSYQLTPIALMDESSAVLVPTELQAVEKNTEVSRNARFAFDCLAELIVLRRTPTVRWKDYTNFHLEKDGSNRTDEGHKERNRARSWLMRKGYIHKTDGAIEEVSVIKEL